ncbi:MAG: tail fiber domain-containing protein, partial [Myxococcales bacterium]|nr:tail fiber domain-containing protein [Myxococcales bacterium]
MPSGESCLETDCCAGLFCCEGVPIPPDQAICYQECPDSDRALKRDIVPVDGGQVLEALGRLPISTWSYKADAPEVRHMGPMAQDFQAAFGLGASERAIHKIDGDGVSLAAIQALLRRLESLEQENQRLRARVEALESRR